MYKRQAQYTPLDVAFKIVGTGSVGLRDYCIYMQGNGAKDPLFLQIKEEPLSAYAPYLGDVPAESHQGRRVVEGQRAMPVSYTHLDVYKRQRSASAAPHCSLPPSASPSASPSPKSSLQPHVPPSSSSSPSSPSQRSPSSLCAEASASPSSP